MDYQKALILFQQSADELTDLLMNTRLDALEYSQVVQTIINIHQEIRRTRIAEKYQTRTIPRINR